MGSVYSGILKLSVFGESHGKAIGMVLDGFPAGMKIDSENLLREIARRKPKNAAYSTKRKEDDIPETISGVYNGVTSGSPLCMQIKNADFNSNDYCPQVYRPSHADYTGNVRYKGFNDPCGGGHFSGRLTAPIVLAGALCKQYLNEKFGVSVYSHIKSIGNIFDDGFDTVSGNCRFDKILDNQIPVINAQAGRDMLEAVTNAAAESDSLGGTIECMVQGVRAGLGSPNFCGVESRLSSFLFAIPAVKGVEFGKGFAFAQMKGSEANDRIKNENGKIVTVTNNNGGILGGITNGMPLCFTVCVKPTPSIGKPQNTVNTAGENVEYTVKGRHDPCIVPRAVPVIESAAAIVILDLYLEAEGYANA